MRINFRQGIVSYQNSGTNQVTSCFTPEFLQLSGSSVNLFVSNRPVTITVAHKNTNYIHVEHYTVPSAWTGLISGTHSWLFWDFNLLTFERTFGVTNLEPIAQPSEPSPTAVDAYNVLIKQIGRHWYDTSTNQHYVWQGAYWQEVLRVVATRVYNGTFCSVSNSFGTYIGTQIGNTQSVFAGRILFDETSTPILRQDKTFFTTEDKFYASAAHISNIRLESNVSYAMFPYDPAISAFTVVAWYGDGLARTAQYSDVGETVVGVLLEPLTYTLPGVGSPLDPIFDSVGSVQIQGTITNPSWNWSSYIGKPLWVENGTLTPVDPFTMLGNPYSKGTVPVARVLSTDTVIFEQGLGGKGDRGMTGVISNLPPASVSTETSPALGGVLISYPPTSPNWPIALGVNDPILTNLQNQINDLLSPLASNVSVDVISGMVSNNVQSALQELYTNKVNKSGDTMTGFLTLHANPVNNFHAATKGYVDSLVNGLVWLDPICLVNLISDIVLAPPNSPQISDAYIMPGDQIGSWSSIGDGHVVVWDGNVWVDLGLITTIEPNGARFGISMTSTTSPSGTFSGHSNKIAVFNNVGTFVSFEIPTQNNAVYVCSASSLHAYNQYAFSGTTWVLFGGGSALTTDGTTLIQNGNILSVRPWASGGNVDAATWQGLVPVDLDLSYATVTHVHPAIDVSITPYAGLVADWGIPTPSTMINLTSSNVQTALVEIMEKKASKTPFYSTMGDLPAAGAVHGMIAHVHSIGKMFFSHSGNWVELSVNDGSVQNHDHVLPYDITFFVAGPAAASTNTTIGMYVATRNITVTGNVANLRGYALTTPTVSVTFNVIKNGNTGTPVGSITFNIGSNTPSSTTVSASTFNLVPGDRLELVSPSVSEGNIANVSVSLVGCSNMGTCPQGS